MKRPVICLMGVTAAGKTELAVELVQRYPLEIISVDSALVYRGMDIGTAKPDAKTLAQAPHRLIDICDPEDTYSAARFRKDALAHIQEITAAGKTPLLVGGTLLYFRALLQGLSPLPAADPEIRQQLSEDARKTGWHQLHQHLQQVDPEAAARIHPNDPQRLQRALEVYLITGQAMSVLQKQIQQGLDEQYDIYAYALVPGDRARLHQRIEKRFLQMLEQGFVEEVRNLLAQYDDGVELPAMRSVGYRQIGEYLAGQLTYAGMTERGIIATRQLAKRQMTWLRGEHAPAKLDPQVLSPSELIKRIAQKLTFLL